MLVAGAVVVLGMAVYLALEVGRAPAPAQAESPRARTTAARPAPAPTRGEPVPARPVAPDRDVPPPASEPRPAVDVEQAHDALQITPAIPDRGNVKLEAVMSEANKAYDRGDFDEAKTIATKVLAQAPGNVRMLRILVSSDCIMGDQLEAQKHYVLLPPGDRAQMRTRCARYGVTFTEP